MTTIYIQDLRAGSDLIFDEETYLNELTNEENYLNELHDEQLLTNKGGSTPSVIATVATFAASAGVSMVVTRASRVVAGWIF